MTRFRWVRMWAGATALALAVVAAPTAAAQSCTVSGKVETTVGPYSPAAINAGKTPALASSAGIACTPTLLVVLGSNSVRATFSSANALKLKNGAAQIAYTASADPAGKVPLTQGKVAEYMQANVVDALGLFGSTNGTLPIYLKPVPGTAPAPGRYTDTITITWDWRICNLISLVVCIGSYDTPSAPVKSEITINLDVAPQDMTIALSSVTRWDTINGTVRPLAVPGSKGRTTLAVRNPDLVALDDGSVALVYKVPAKTSLALDGDGTGSPVVGFSEGSPASGVTVSYMVNTPGSTTDDVDFSADNGATWTYAPVAGNRASEATITHVRFRPKGAMKAGGTFTLSFPYLVR